MKFFNLTLSLFLYLFFANPLCSAVTETNHFADVLVSIQEDCSDVLVVFDIDDTLLESPICLNSGPWVAYYWNTLPKMMPEKLPVIEELMWHLALSVPVNPVEENIASLIRELQKSPSLTVLALTARPFYQKRINGVRVTIEQLQSIGVKFSSQDHPLAFSKHPTFHEGILYTCGKKKGQFLMDFFAMVGYIPKKVIFVDDNKEQIQSVAQAMQELLIPVDCIWYRRSSSKRPLFDPQVANIQLEHLLKYRTILSDEEANKSIPLLPEPAAVPNRFLQQLINAYEDSITP